MKLKIITTEDGSHSLYREDLHESYHSFRGAKGESMHVFIKHGLEAVIDDNPRGINVFEVGFGTGLNALLTATFAIQNQKNVHYVTLEPYPVPKEIWQKLNYGEGFEQEELLQKLHSVSWEEEMPIFDQFRLLKLRTTLENLDIATLQGSFDVIFFDAFAPGKQAEVWQLDNLKKCYDLLTPGGILTTYCAQGQFKRNLAAAGFEVETLKGAMGKKEMARGRKVNKQ